MDDDQEIATPENKGTETAPENDTQTSGADLLSIANGLTDTIGTTFDPSIHAVGPDGQPRKRGDGSYALKRGRKPGQGARAATDRQPGAGMIAPTQATRETITNDEAARQLCNAAIGVMVATVGEEWAPKDKAEGDGLRIAVKNYFDAKGQINLPPEVGLAIAVLAYSLPRLQVENTRTKFEGWFLRARSWFRKIKG